MCVLGCDALLVPPANAHAFCARASGCGLSIDREAQNMTVSTDVLADDDDLPSWQTCQIPKVLGKFRIGLANLKIAAQPNTFAHVDNAVRRNTRRGDSISVLAKCLNVRYPTPFSPRGGCFPLWYRQGKAHNPLG